MAYTYLIRNNCVGVELYIDSDSAEKNEEIFDELKADAAQIEDEFGSELEWERLEDKRACRIRKQVADSGLTDDDEWNQIQDAMVDAMKRFHNTIDKRIQKIS